MKQRTTKKTILDSLAKYFIKKMSNCFWEIADAWSYKNEKIAQLYSKSIVNEYRKEYENCGVHGNVDILHIGCGAYPLTDIVLAGCSTGHIVGIDKNPQTVKRAQQILQKNKLENHILIRHGDGLDYPVNNQVHGGARGGKHQEQERDPLRHGCTGRTGATSWVSIFGPEGTLSRRSGAMRR